VEDKLNTILTCQHRWPYPRGWNRALDAERREQWPDYCTPCEKCAGGHVTIRREIVPEQPVTTNKRLTSDEHSSLYKMMVDAKEREWSTVMVNTDLLEKCLYGEWDDPEWDATDAAHPAWWRGEDHASDNLLKKCLEWLRCENLDGGTISGGWQEVREKIGKLMRHEREVGLGALGPMMLVTPVEYAVDRKADYERGRADALAGVDAPKTAYDRWNSEAAYERGRSEALTAAADEMQRLIDEFAKSGQVSIGPLHFAGQILATEGWVKFLRERAAPAKDASRQTVPDKETP
jgi:hypothetical protein